MTNFGVYFKMSDNRIGKFSNTISTSNRNGVISIVLLQFLRPFEEIFEEKKNEFRQTKPNNAKFCSTDVSHHLHDFYGPDKHFYCHQLFSRDDKICNYSLNAGISITISESEQNEKPKQFIYSSYLIHQIGFCNTNRILKCSTSLIKKQEKNLIIKKASRLLRKHCEMIHLFVFRNFVGKV